jgi:putative endonuclease
VKTHSNKEIGAIGEHIAAKYLISKGYKVVEFNYWKPYGEIDIICTKDRVIHFVEVKTVSREIGQGVIHETDWNPAEKIGSHKLARMVRTIDTYIQEKGIEGDWQMDAVLVELDTQGKRAKVGLIENISPYL